MTILITGICGFTGSTVARALQDLDSTIELFGIDNFIRPGSERNRGPLQSADVRLYHGDVRQVILSLCQELIGPSMPLPIRVCFRAWTANRTAGKSSNIPLKAIVRGYSWTTIPINWRNSIGRALSQKRAKKGTSIRTKRKKPATWARRWSLAVVTRGFCSSLIRQANGWI